MRLSKAAIQHSRIHPFILIFCTAMMLTSLNSDKSYAQGRAFHERLANGMDIVVIPDRRAPVVTHMVWYKAGSADEPAGKSGIAHFLEHLMFKGTNEIPPGEFSKIVARNGGQDNAFTSYDITSYFQRVSKDRLPVVMRMEADRMVNLVLDEQNVKTEQKVILEERRMRVDNDPSNILSEHMNAALYMAHPYRVPIIGWENEIRGLTREDALTFYKHFYAPNNAVLVVAGDVEPAQVMELAQETYGKLPANPAIKARQRVREPEQNAERRVIVKDERAGKATLYRTYLAPSYATAKEHEAEALELLAKIAGSSSNSRMYNRLVVTDKIASSASGWYSGTGLDSGTITFYAVAAGDTPLETIEHAMDAVFADVREHGVTQEELDRARNAAIADLVYTSDNQAVMARLYGWALASGETVEAVESREQRLTAVTLGDIREAARKYLDMKRSVTGLLIPVPSGSAKVVEAKPLQPGGIIH